ncbi:MAG: hypothetical protein IPJ38_08960 [Dechloromonas sp.]|uniref:Uncharacterized protein n=1 Tax=Candidatus Dechloromonas phosphorivorans TaxID=2899244 RepID=A0A935MT26_9RHOO|nr:hypothetical protein [Candidatus Dechloromonas phosphorivorans]
MRRREFVLSCVGLALLPAAVQANPRLDTLTSGLQRWGSGEFRRWGFLVYEATLWAKDDRFSPM